MIVYGVIGIFAGLLAGLFGVGGGLIVVPALIMVFHQKLGFQSLGIMHMAIGTSLAAMIPTSMSSAYAYHRRSALNWFIFLEVFPGLCLGILVGSMIMSRLNNTLLTDLFIGLLGIMAIHMLWDTRKSTKPSPAKESNPSIQDTSTQIILVVASVFIGISSALFGIGGGVLLVPLFLMVGLPLHCASGTSSLCGVVVAIVGAIILTLSGLSQHTSAQIPGGTLGYIYWPGALCIAIAGVICAPMGARLAFILNTVLLKRLFAVLIIGCAWNLYWHYS